MRTSAWARVVGQTVLALAALGACKSEPSAKIDPEFLEAYRLMMTQACACTKVPRDQLEACTAKRKALPPKVPGGGDVEKYRETLRAADRAEWADIEVQTRACVQILIDTRN